MENYPRTLVELEARFSSEQACREYLFQLRWPEGFRCPRCGAAKSWPLRSVLWQCAGCGRQVSVTAGTIFQDTHTPLTVWVRAMWWVTAQKNGVSALGLQRVLGFGSYQTAWAWLHKLRRAMVRPDREMLGGPGASVEMDCTFVGGRSPGTKGKGGVRYANKAEVVIALELRHPKGFGRVRLASIDSQWRKDEIVDFIRANVAPGTTLYTDGDKLYHYLPRDLGIAHVPIVLVSDGEPAHRLLPGVHRVASLLKRWLEGTLHDGQAPTSLDYYLDEFTFRFSV